ncbi:hypothetical protein F5050DRAFT_1789424 [Lentinula boryana]|uniref:Uncharacterized protein n=1 Tax=Lentinula boryana TaxID=40481 RepID=A0ABQ8Q120_9AGAR|nr:hypothetical protein F5050DRAFT_1789424 [Lentinula boryana]
MLTKFWDGIFYTQISTYQLHPSIDPMMNAFPLAATTQILMSDIERQSLTSDEATVKPDVADFASDEYDEFSSRATFTQRRGGRPPNNSRPPNNNNRPPNNNNRPPNNNNNNRPRLPRRVVVQQMIEASGVAVAAAQLGVDIATLLGYVNGDRDD